MPDQEVNPTTETPPVEAPQENQPAFLSEAQEQAPPPAAAPPAEEPAFEPAWLTKPIQAEPQYQPAYTPQQYAPPQPQYVPQYQPAPQYIPQPQQYAPPQPPQMTLEQFVQNPQAAFEMTRERAKQEALASLMPVVQEVQAVRGRQQQIEAFQRQAHEGSVAQAFEQTRAVIRDTGYKGVFAKDPAIRNKDVQKALDEAVTGYLAHATQLANAYGDYSGYRNAADPATMKLILQWAKDKAGWGEGAKPPVQYSGGTLETGRSQPAQSRPELDDDLRDAIRKMGVSEDVVAARIAERKKLGWG